MPTATLPTSASDLYPALPDCAVSRIDDAVRRAVATRLSLEARRDQLAARRDQVSLDLPNLILAGKTVDPLLDEVADVKLELARLDGKIQTLALAEAELSIRRIGLERTDPVFVSIERRRREIDAYWFDAMKGLPKESDGATGEQIERARRTAIFGVAAMVQSEKDDLERDGRDRGSIRRGRR